MMPQRFETTQWVPFPVELVFAFFANPHNLPHIMPPELHARIENLRLAPPPPRPVAADPSRRFESLAAGTGTEIVISFTPVSWLPVRLSWTAKIVEFAWYSHFTDNQVRGPLGMFRQRHGIFAEMRNDVEGTLVSDIVDYALPGGSFLRSDTFDALGEVFMLPQLEKMFAYRHKRLPEVLAAASKQATRRS